MDNARFKAEIQELHRTLEWIRTRLIKGGVPKSMIGKLELASEEAIVNVIQHAYPGKKGEIEISLKWSLDQVEIVVRDWGPPFNPLKEAPKVAPLAPIEEREAGGLGIYLIEQIMDELRYFREKDENVLVMIKKLL